MKTNKTNKTSKRGKMALVIAAVVVFLSSTASSCTTQDGRNCVGAATTCAYEKLVQGK